MNWTLIPEFLHFLEAVRAETLFVGIAVVPLFLTVPPHVWGSFYDIALKTQQEVQIVDLTKSGQNFDTEWTRTTRTPAFWWYPCRLMITHTDLKSKEYKVKVTNLKNLPKLQICIILKQFLHMTHFLKLLDKMCKYEMDPTSIVEDTERTRFCPQTHGRTDGRTDGQGETSIPPFQLRWSGGIISHHLTLTWLFTWVTTAASLPIHWSYRSLAQRHW